jgi:hypothetical protein
MFLCVDMMNNELERRDTGFTVARGGEVLQMGPLYDISSHR